MMGKQKARRRLLISVQYSVLTNQQAVIDGRRIWSVLFLQTIEPVAGGRRDDDELLRAVVMNLAGHVAPVHGTNAIDGVNLRRVSIPEYHSPSRSS